MSMNPVAVDLNPRQVVRLLRRTVGVVGLLGATQVAFLNALDAFSGYDDVVPRRSERRANQR